MKTEELESYMLNDPYISKVYGGVVAHDQLPLRINKPSIFIVNSDTIMLPGKHWYALYFDVVNEHFDSAGSSPDKTLENYLIAYGPNYLYNSQRVQSPHSDTCGLFCLFYCFFRCRGFSFSRIMNMFSKNLTVNEAVVKYFYALTK